MGFSKYYNQEYSIEISYPNHWDVIEGYAGTLVSFLSPYDDTKDKFRENMNVIILRDLEPVPNILQDFSLKSLLSLQEEANPTKIITSLTDATLSGIPAKIYSYNQKEGKLKLFTFHIWTIQDFNAYILSWSGLKKDKDKFIPIFNEIIESFKILK